MWLVKLVPLNVYVADNVEIKKWENICENMQYPNSYKTAAKSKTKYCIQWHKDRPKKVKHYVRQLAT